MSFHPQRPYVPVPVAALKLLEEHLDEGDQATAKLVLMALYRIGNRDRTHTITKGRAYIGKLASLSVPTVTRRIGDLERLGLIKVQRSDKLKTANTYILPKAVGSLKADDESLRSDVESGDGSLPDPLPKQETCNNSEGQSAKTSNASSVGKLRRLVCEGILERR